MAYDNDNKRNAAIYKLPFHEQLRHYLAKRGVIKSQQLTQFATQQRLSIDPEIFIKLCQGKLTPTVKIANELSDKLALSYDESGERSLAGLAFINAVNTDKKPVELLEDFIAVHTPSSDYALGKLFGIDYQAVAYFREHGTIAKYKYVSSVADVLGLKGKVRKKFYQQVGWAADKNHVIELLQNDEMSLDKAIHCLCSIAGLEKQQAADLIDVNPATFRGWTNSSQQIPPMDKMKAMASKKLFDLSSEQEKIFLAAAGYYQNKVHLCEAMRYKPLSRKEVVRALVDIEGESVEGYAKKIGVKPSLVYSWIDVSIPRSRIMDLIKDIPRDDQQKIIEKTEHFLDISDIMTRAKEAGKLEVLILGIKDIHDKTDDDFAVAGATIRKHCNQGDHMSPESMSVVFADLEKRYPEMMSHWNDYKDIYVRERGLEGKEHQRKEISKKMDDELEKLRSADKKKPSRSAFRGGR